jgi:hypothetical protein
MLTVCFQTELVLNTHTMVSDIHHIMVRSQEGVDGAITSVSIAWTLPIT